MTCSEQETKEQLNRRIQAAQTINEFIYYCAKPLITAKSFQEFLLLVAQNLLQVWA